MGIALLWTYGFFSWCGWPQDSILEVLSPLIMTIGTCDAVHFLSQTGQNFSRDADRETLSSSILEAAKEVGPACTLTTVTTAVALASFATSELNTFVRFGTAAAFGAVACLLLTFTFVPVLAQAIGIGQRTQARQGWHLLLRAVGDTARRKRVAIVTVTAVALVLVSVGMFTRLRVDTEVGEMYGEQNRVTRWTRFVERHLRGLESLEVDIRFPSETTILDPRAQAKVAELTSYLESQPGLDEALSVQDVMAQLNRVLNDDDEAFLRTADTEAGNAELLELVGFDSPDLLDAWITPDRRHIRIAVEAASAEPVGSEDFVAEMTEALNAMVPSDWEITLTGSYILDFEWVGEVQATQVTSFATAFAIVLILVTLFLRSVPLGLLAMFPAVIPVVVILGFLGWSDLPLDIGRLMIAAIVIGIGVDDSIHLLKCYQHYCAMGIERHEAMTMAIERVGRALVITSFALALGFITLTLSAWQTISSFGFFVCMAVLLALGVVLFVVPAVFFILAPNVSPASDSE